MTSSSYASNPNDVIYRLYGGCDTGGCVEIDDGVLSQVIDSQVTVSKKGKAKGKGESTLVRAISMGTGMAVDAASAAYSGLSQAALAAGYTDLTATLSGPSGEISFTVNFATNAWSMSASGGGLKCPVGESCTPPVVGGNAK